MRKFLISIAATTAALAVASPADAQWAPAPYVAPVAVQWVPPVYRYQPYNFGYGFSGIRFAQAMENRVQRIRNDIHAMAMRRILGFSEARALDNQARNLQRRIAVATRFGIAPGEARGIENGIRRLEFRVAREATDWNNRPGRYRRY